MPKIGVAESEYKISQLHLFNSYSLQRQLLQVGETAQRTSLPLRLCVLAKRGVARLIHTFNQ
ncbi:MAG: hypothetical protein KME59_12210 [Trichormus sp. ATA11-4-KO1]|jgi:hypothetical protein|nr:hypothetical protein [Trichormus sp. ATA11-4-KO1]